MEVDGKSSMGMPPPVRTVHCCVCYPGGEVIHLGAVTFGEIECLCRVKHWHKNENSLEGVTEERGH